MSPVHKFADIRICFLACIYTCIFISTSINASWIKGKMFTGWGYPVPNDTPTANSSFLHGKSNYYECVKNCMDYEDCFAVTFSRTTGFCTYQTQWFSYITKTDDDSVLIILKPIMVSYMVQPGTAGLDDAHKLCAETGQIVINGISLAVIHAADKSTICQCGYYDMFGTGIQANPCTGVLCTDKIGVYCTWDGN